MESKAISKHVRSSPIKVRIVADLVRKKKVNAALAMLGTGLVHKAAREIECTLKSAVANLQNKSEAANIDIDDLYVKAITVDEGPMLKRIRPRAQGRAYSRLHRFCHITVIVSD